MRIRHDQKMTFSNGYQTDIENELIHHICKKTYFCRRMLINLIHIKQTETFCKKFMVNIRKFQFDSK